MYELMDAVISIIDVIFLQLLPTLFLLVGAAFQFLLDFLLSFSHPNRPFSNPWSSDTFFPPQEACDCIVYDADYRCYCYEEERSSSTRQSEEELRHRWQTMRSLNGSETRWSAASRSPSPVRSIQLSEGGYDNNNCTRHNKNRVPLRNAAHVIHDTRQWKHMDCVDGIMQNPTNNGGHMHPTGPSELIRRRRRPYNPCARSRFSHE
ncbi:hypothetical protein KP509_11G005900 [Ceratopteris richardii]|uniref:Uncharacterized protein n=1 Tax=Ceratopteris richardii TaxID=49495 RepID=A0A8T2TPL6_CERRI|nr:hypothetical protein KP509_11G005900 [Ceratopteris richardii]